jgi:hypothetical protein
MRTPTRGLTRLGHPGLAAVTAFALGALTSVTHAGLMPGGGKAASDCYAVFDVANVADGGGVVECQDGDACDADGATNGACVFSARVCLNDGGMPGCTPKGVNRLRFSAGPRLAKPALPAADNVCGQYTDVRVALKKRAVKKRTIVLTAAGAGKPRADRDRLRLVCLACPTGNCAPRGADGNGGGTTSSTTITSTTSTTASPDGGFTTTTTSSPNGTFTTTTQQLPGTTTTTKPPKGTTTTTKPPKGTTSTTCPETTTTTTSPGGSFTTTTVEPGGTTTTTLQPPGDCDCCAANRLRFVTAPPTDDECGTVEDDTGNEILTLSCGGLYFGGGSNGVPLPAAVPDTGTSDTTILTCDANTGALTLGPTTSATTGSDRTCTSAGCFFGPPLPIPNPNSIATSTCVVNIVAQDANGTANCSDGSVESLSLPLASGIYLTGDAVPGAAGIQPCPLCEGGTCQGGPNNGSACTPGSTDLGDPYPTSHDCPPDPNAFLGALPIGFNLSTGEQTRSAVDQPAQPNVFCGFCATVAGVFSNPAVPCTSDAQCTTGNFTRCRQRSPGAFSTDVSTFATARTITATGEEAGLCLADGAPADTTLVSVFCIPPTFNGLVDGSADLPGPGAVALIGEASLVTAP